MSDEKPTYEELERRLAKAEAELRGLARYPSENPNPVLRATGEGTIFYANRSAEKLLRAWGCHVGETLPEKIRQVAADVSASRSASDVEVQCEGRTLLLTFAPVSDAGCVNLYGLDITERKQAEQQLRRIEWVLTEKPSPESRGEQGYEPSYGNLAKLNTCRVLLDSVGQETLKAIGGDCLDLLETSGAVYERNGDYALGIFSSGWCRFLNEASRELCGTDDNRQALECGKWHCHESCWREASKVSMDTAQPVDVECLGGIRLYAVPIRAGREIIGSINFGYGDPPRDRLKLDQIAERYRVSVDELRRRAGQYQSRPPFLIAVAKSRLLTAASLIGEIVERKRAEEKARHALEQLAERERREKEHVAAELDKAREELIRTTRLAAIGQVSASIAHDLRNPLGVATNAIYYLRHGRAKDASKTAEYLEMIDQEIRAANRIIGKLLDMAHDRKPDKQAVDLGRAVDEVFQAAPGAQRMRCRTILCPDPFLVRADADQLRQVIGNLLSNAVEATRGREEFLVEATRGPEGDTILFRDTGPGIDPEIRQTMFDPLVSGRIRGTGLGLTICREIVRRHGGTIEAVEHQEGGAAIRVWLPRG